MYGPFTNELLVGRVLKERRSEAFVSTKVGLLVGEQHIVANGRPGYVRRACDASLRRLQTDVIDLYQLHRADPEVPVEETWGAMADLVSAGKVRSLGLCAVGARSRPSCGGAPARRTIRQLERVQQVFPVSAVEAELSVWLDGGAGRVAAVVWVARGVGFLAAMPLGNGFLQLTLTPVALESMTLRCSATPASRRDDGREPAPRRRAAAYRPAPRSAREHGHAGPGGAGLGAGPGTARGPGAGGQAERWVTENAGRRGCG